MKILFKTVLVVIIGSLKVSKVLGLCGGRKLNSIEKYPFFVNICTDSAPTERQEEPFKSCVDGVILSRDWVLGPSYRKEPLTTVWFGRNNIDDFDPEKKRTIIDTVEVQPHKKAKESIHYQFILLHKLNNCLHFTKTVSPAKLPPFNFDMKNNEKFVIVGTGENCLENYLNSAFETINARTIKNKEWNQHALVKKRGKLGLPDFRFATNFVKGGLCSVFTGSPAVTINDSFLIGLGLGHSYSIPLSDWECSERHLSNFWKISRYVESIEKITKMKRNGTTGYLEYIPNTKYNYHFEINPKSDKFTLKPKTADEKVHVGITLLLIMIFIFTYNLNYSE